MEDWERLARTVHARRVELGMNTRNELADATGLTTRILSDVEHHRRTSYSKTTLLRLERALGWAPGSIDKVLTGGSPVVGNEAPIVVPSDDMDPIAAEVVYVLSPGSPLEQEERDDFRMILDQLLRRYRTIIRQAGQDGGGK